jgi:hypothetical protein
MLASLLTLTKPSIVPWFEPPENNSGKFGWERWVWTAHHQVLIAVKCRGNLLEALWRVQLAHRRFGNN